MDGRTMIFLEHPPGWFEYTERSAEIAQLLDTRCYTMEWLDAQIMNGDARVFASDDAVIVVAVKQYPAGATELHGLVAAGALEAILALIDESTAWAAQVGVTFACIASRPGWGRVLKDRGFSLYQTELRKDL